MGVPTCPSRTLMNSDYREIQGVFVSVQKGRQGTAKDAFCCRENKMLAMVFIVDLFKSKRFHSQYMLWGHI